MKKHELKQLIKEQILAELENPSGIKNYKPVNEGFKDTLVSGLAAIILSFGTIGSLQAKDNESKIKTELSQKINKLTPEQQELVSNFIKYCENEGRQQFNNFKNQKNKEDKKDALDLLIESFCDEMGFTKNDDEKNFLLTLFNIKNILDQIK
jgi:hypothetical protein